MYPLPVYNGNTRARRMGPPRAFSFTQGNQPSMLFDAMGGTTVLGRGGQTPTFTRATVATVTDQDLVVRQVLSGEARFGGFRRVQNLHTATETLTAGAWSGNFVTGDGVTSASGAIATATVTASGRAVFQQPVTATALVGEVYVVRVELTSFSGATQTIADFMGAAGTATATVTTSGNMGAVGVYSFTITIIGAGTLSIRYGVGCSGVFGAARSVSFRYPQCQNVTGQSNQNPAEYVSVGVLSAPYQGANVDGVQYFPYLNGNTVASNVVTEARGAAISSSILGGYLPEPAATDLLTARADARDMTTANWTLGATMTRARTSVGADGVANKATRLTGGAVAATNIITTTITAAASSRTYSVLIKRVTGTGTVLITQDNFATTTDVTALINSSTFTLVQMVQSQLNAVLGIKISTNGDAIDADWNQFSAGDLTGLINSRIPDTITTRNADVLTYATTGWLNAAAGTLYAEWFNPNLSQTIKIASLNDGSGANLINAVAQTITTARTLVLVGAATQSDLSAVTITGAAVAKMVTIYQLNDFAGYANNTTLGTDAAGTIPALTRIEIGEENGSGHTGHYIRKVAYYPTRMTNESAKALTV